MHLRKRNLGGQRPATGPRRQELAAEETVLRVSLRLSDRKRDWIQRGTGNVSLPGLPGGGDSHPRTRLRREIPCKPPFCREFSACDGNWHAVSSEVLRVGQALT